jgi:DNA invertase Pin-like site-specific DNA recombinase
MKTLEERFWKKVKKSSDPHGCWMWTGEHHGELNGSAKLSEMEAGWVYRIAKTGFVTYTRIAKMFDISKSQVANIKHRRQWNHLEAS